MTWLATVPDWAWWMAAGLVMLATEMMLPGVFLVWIGSAAVVVGMAVLWLGLGFAASVALFLGLLAAGLTLSVRARRGRVPPAVNAPEAGLAGRVGVLLEAGPAGVRVRLGDSDWPARLLEPAEAGAAVRVEGVEGTVLVVRPA